MAAEMALEVVLGTAIQQLLTVIEQVRESDFRFESILNDLKSTLDSAFPKITEICQLRESNGLPNDELLRLLEQLNQAMVTFNKCYKVAWWNYSKKRKYMKELVRVNASLRNFFHVNLPMDQYKNTTLIQVQLKDLAKRLDGLKTGQTNASRRILHQSQYKVYDAASELKKIVQSLPGWTFLYLRSVLRIPRWGYHRITNSFRVNSSQIT